MSDMLDQIGVQIGYNNQSVVIDFLPASGASGTLNLTLNQLTDLIQRLGNIRTQMVTGNEIPLLQGQNVTAVSNTRWHVQPEPPGDGSALTFYHPSFGTLGFLLPRDQVSKMVRLLTKHLEIHPLGSGKPN